MYKYFTIIFVLFIIIFSSILPNVKSSNYNSQKFENKIKKLENSKEVMIDNKKILLLPEVFKFYKIRGYSLAWCRSGELLPHAYKLMTVLKEVNYEGLNPEEYNLSLIKRAADKLKDHDQQVKQQIFKVDLLLTDAFLRYASHLLIGENNPYGYSKRTLKKKETGIVKILEKAVNTGRIKESLRMLTPDLLSYFKMRRVIRQYQRIVEEGGWNKIPPGSKLKRGDHGERVALLKKRLRISGDLKGLQGIKEQLFDRSLEMAVYRFQYRHGLKIDGIVGKETLRALNISAKRRLEQLKLNMKRLRWLPGELGEEYIFVNIADLQLKAVNKEQVVRTMKVIVGMPTRQTPLFRDKITYLVINPYWYIPRQIAVRDILPVIKKDPGYLIRQDINVFRNWQYGADRIKPGEVNWSQVNGENFDYKLRQEPGPNNPLGRIKFMFPNEYNVYLHDTPEKELFKKNYRAFSSGCIRVEKPIELAQYLLQHNSNWNREKVLRAIRKGKKRVIELSKPVPVYIVYLTAWVSGDGTVQFRNDIYNRDF